MHTILFSWPFQFDTIEPYVQMLRTAGLALRTPQSDRFGRGEMNEEETIGELQGVSAVIAFVSVRWLLRYIETHTFVAFGWYRIALGMVLLVFIIS